jgi:photosystem II stability/assembly factor-like uncharacterized protein
MGFNHILIDIEGELFASSGCDIDLYGNRRVGDDAIVNNIYFSEDDGETWTPMLDDNPFRSGIKKLLQHPTNPNIYYAATGTGVYMWDGTTWTDQGYNLNFRNIASMAVGENYIYVGTAGGGVYASRIDPDYSLDWQQSTGPFPEIYNIQVRIDPTDSDILYASAYPGGVYKSTDGGATWMESNFALPSFVVDDPRLQGYYSLEIDSNNPDILYLGIFGKGIYKSYDGAGVWIPMYGRAGQNKDIMQKGITQIRVNTEDSDTVYLSTNEGFYVSYDGAENWVSMNDGLTLSDIVSFAINPERNMIYVGTRGASVWKASLDNFQWSQTAGPRTNPRICWIKIDPTNSDVIYIGLNPAGMYKSEDGGLSWREINRGLINTVVYPIEFNPMDSNEIYVGTGYGRDLGSLSGGDAGVYKSDNGGEIWYPTANGLPWNIIVNDIKFDPKNPNVIYIATEHSQHPDHYGIFMSDDRGRSWKPINNNNIEEFPIYVFAFDSTGDMLYVGTGFGGVWKGIRK